jgi:cathepsin A (carboxypeptidase C)
MTNSSTPVLSTNPYSWNQKYDVMYVDQPIGVGYSRVDGLGCSDTDCSTHDLYVFLTKFFINHPDYISRDFYITGESYAGHYIPKLAEYILKQGFERINLKGVAIGNGWFVPINQIPSYPTFAYENKLIGLWKMLVSTVMMAISRLFIVIGDNKQAFHWNEEIGLNYIWGDPPTFNEYDIRRKDSKDVDEYIIDLLTQPAVQQILNTTDRPYFKVGEQITCNHTVENMFVNDRMSSVESSMRFIIEKGIKVLMYTGNKDYICNIESQESWLSKFDWRGASDINKGKYASWQVNGKAVGEYKKYENFMHLVVFDAGHMVPTNQPAVAQKMLNDFILGQLS